MPPAPAPFSGTSTTVRRGYGYGPNISLYAAADCTDLERTDELVVHLDVAHRGLGTASCGPDTLPLYRIESGTWRLAYVVSTAPTG